MREWCRSKSHYGLEVVGLLTNDQVAKGDGWPPVLGRVNDLEQIIEEHGVNQVVALNLPNSLERMAQIGRLCDRLGVRVLALNDLQERFKRPVSFFEDGGLRFVALREEPLECPANRILKRTVDIALSLPIILFVLPFISLFVAVAHRLQSPGPLFFRQKRTGINFGTFSIYKFRTMHVANPDATQQARKADPRVFKLGRWMRRMSLDELPQFINVLKGEMSIVGPRPHMVEHDAIFAKVASSYHVRSLVKPGITGLAQVRGFRGEAITDRDVIGRVESDVYYLENWSFSMEWSIIFKTALQVVLPPKTAY
jgi:putative colanic acid biosynthesis UDP-glucose lipid carrier transferase